MLRFVTYASLRSKPKYKTLSNGRTDTRIISLSIFICPESTQTADRQRDHNGTEHCHTYITVTNAEMDSRVAYSQNRLKIEQELETWVSIEPRQNLDKCTARKECPFFLCVRSLLLILRNDFWPFYSIKTRRLAFPSFSLLRFSPFTSVFKYDNIFLI